MTRKDYKLIAKVFNDYLSEHVMVEDQTPAIDLMFALADAFQEDNDKFDFFKFEEACWK
jgi:hypothetical protein